MLQSRTWLLLNKNGSKLRKVCCRFPSSQHLCQGDDCSERPGDHCVYTGCSAEFWWSSAALARFSFLLHKFILFNDVQCLVLRFHNILDKAVVYMAGWPRVGDSPFRFKSIQRSDSFWPPDAHVLGCTWHIPAWMVALDGYSCWWNRRRDLRDWSDGSFVQST